MRVTGKHFSTLLIFQLSCLLVAGFVNPNSKSHQGQRLIAKTFPLDSPQTLVQVSSSASGEVSTSAPKKKKKSIKDFREEGGILSINTPIGALNPFAVYYGLLSLFLGVPWYIALKSCQFLYWVTRGKFDKKVRISKVVF